LKDSGKNSKNPLFPIYLPSGEIYEDCLQKAASISRTATISQTSAGFSAAGSSAPLYAPAAVLGLLAVRAQVCPQGALTVV
jgi:hypothetical protein